MFSFLFILCCVTYVSNLRVMGLEVTPPEYITGDIITGVIQNGGASSRSLRATTCILPPYPDHGTYELLNVENSQPGQSFDSFILSVSCQQEYGLHNPNIPYGNSTLVYCIQGIWPQPMPKCVRFCKLDPHPSVDYFCHIPDVGYTSCEGYSAPGTVINPICKSPNYFSTEIIIDMECISGQWNYIAKCKADCGRVLPEGGMGLIISGTYSRRGQVPWHAGIYRKTSTPYEQICGGSIVTNNVIISAAHCFVSRNPSDYAVASGKIYRPWDDKVDDVNAQKSDVKAIKIPGLYQGEVSHFGVDIAVLILATPFVYNTIVRPVCLNFDTNFDKLQLQHGKLGKVAGWGLTTANGNASPFLLVVDLPFIEDQTCINNLPEHFKPYITVDKFCAGYTNGTALCRGDSGGGLAFFDKELGIERYYLRGIVSTAARSDENIICNDHTYTAFTRVTTHQGFIKSVIALSERKTCQGADCNGIQECKGSPDLCKAPNAVRRPPKPYEESCEWKGIKGKCLPSKVCLTALDNDSEKPPVCPDKNGQLNYICCTDCQLVNDTSNFVLGADSDMFWKDGRKARDACLQYLKDVPHVCYQEGNSAGITRKLDIENKCHIPNFWSIPGRGIARNAANPNEALLGTGDDTRTEHWYHIGTIITDKFILTAAFTANLPEKLRQAAVPRSRGSTIKDWKIHTVKKIYTHPAYKNKKETQASKDALYNDIALLELEIPITFNTEIYPACLPDPAEEFDTTTAKHFHYSEVKIFNVEKITTEECNAQISDLQKRLLPQKINSDSQLCYKTKDNCYYNWGPPITVSTQYSRCMNTVIGIGSMRLTCEIAVFTNVKHYTPWIESIVWPSNSTKSII